MRDWYPERKIFASDRLRVSALHELHIEQSGNPDGKPVLFNHGGPGTGILKHHGRQFDPDFYRIIQFDQRGAGKSTPYADIRENTTQHLISDIEEIRRYLGIDKWVVGGRSWGATLSLLYAEAHPQQVSALYLPAVFLCDRRSSLWLFQDGASRIFSEEWSKFEELIPRKKRSDMMSAYKELLFSDDPQVALQAALTWSRWEAITVSMLPDQAILDNFASPEVTLALARLECHYLLNGGFIEEGQILRDAHKISHIPTKIIHGRYDMNCTHDGALQLHRALPKSELITVPLGGHAANDPATVDVQIKAAEALKELS